jgi:hypothetical protein
MLLRELEVGARSRWWQLRDQHLSGPPLASEDAELAVHTVGRAVLEADGERSGDRPLS